MEVPLPLRASAVGAYNLWHNGVATEQIWKDGNVAHARYVEQAA
jgi:hypothetical protein